MKIMSEEFCTALVGALILAGVIASGATAKPEATHGEQHSAIAEDAAEQHRSCKE